MKIVVRQIIDPQREIVCLLFGENEELNWIEAAWHPQRIVAQAHAQARETERAHEQATNGTSRLLTRSWRRRRRQFRATKPSRRVFGFWDWVGGRYSMDSAIGLSRVWAVGLDEHESSTNGLIRRYRRMKGSA